MWYSCWDVGVLYNSQTLLVLRRIIETIVFSNIWIAILASGLTINTYILAKYPINYKVCLLVFFSTFFVYNFQRFIKHFIKKQNYSKRHLWIYNNVYFVFCITIFSFVFIALLSLSIFSTTEIIILLPFSFISVFYTISIFKKNSIREIPFLKIFFIAITWSVATVLVPFLDMDITLSKLFWGNFMFTFFFIIAITIPFDIRDILLDNKKIKTLPQVFGVKKSILLSRFILILCFFINFLIFFSPSYPIILTIYYFVIGFSNRNMQELFYSGILDGLMLLFPLLTMVLY